MAPDSQAAIAFKPVDQSLDRDLLRLLLGVRSLPLQLRLAKAQCPDVLVVVRLGDVERNAVVAQLNVNALCFLPSPNRPFFVLVHSLSALSARTYHLTNRPSASHLNPAFL
jgi:hypothetical protein